MLWPRDWAESASFTKNSTIPAYEASGVWGPAYRGSSDETRSPYLTCTLLVTCAVEHVGYVVGGHGLGLELSAGQSDGDVLQGA